MAEFDVEEQPYPDYNNQLEYGKEVLHQLGILAVGVGNSVMITDKYGTRWGSKSFDAAPAWIKMDGSFKLKNTDGDILLDSHNVSGNFLNVINEALNTNSQEILKDFTFETTDYAGAFKTGNITWNASTGEVTGGTGILINANGIVGALSGTAKFTIETNGDATFGGTLVAASGTFGTVTAGTFTGCTFQTATSGYRQRINSSGYQFLNGSTLIGSFQSDAMSSVKIDTSNDIYFTEDDTYQLCHMTRSSMDFPSRHSITFASGTVLKDEGSNLDIDRACEFHGSIYPSSDNSYECGGSGSRWSKGWFEDAQIDDLWLADTFGGCGTISGCAYNEVNLMTSEQVAEYKDDVKSGNAKNKNYTKFEEGDVLAWKREKLVKCVLDTCACVTAVSDKNGMPTVLGAELIKVIGKVAMNQFLVTSPVEGYARAWMGTDDPPVGAVIAQALENKKDVKQGLIKAMIRKF